MSKRRYRKRRVSESDEDEVGRGEDEISGTGGEEGNKETQDDVV